MLHFKFGRLEVNLGDDTKVLSFNRGLRKKKPSTITVLDGENILEFFTEEEFREFTNFVF